MHTSIRCPLKYLCKIICKKNMDQWGGNLTVICIYDLSFWLNPKISFKFSKLRATHFLKLQRENLVSQVCMKMYWNCRKKINANHFFGLRGSCMSKNSLQNTKHASWIYHITSYNILWKPPHTECHNKWCILTDSPIITRHQKNYIRLAYMSLLSMINSFKH